MIKIKSQRIISLTLILAMLMSMFTFSGFTVGADEGQDAIAIWSGETKTPADSDGDGVYEITSGEELAYVVFSGGGADTSYKLTSDIYLNDINKIDWTTGEAKEDYIPNSWYANHSVAVGFQGTIDGDGHTVYGLYLEGNPSSYTVWKEGTGLIPLLAEDSTTEIKNLGVDYTYFHYETSASAFVGVAPTGASLSIDCCYVGENVTLKAATAAAFRAYAGSAAGTNITNSYSLATTIGTGHTGLIGHAWNEKVVIKNSYNAKGLIISDPWQYAVDQGIEDVYATDNGAYVDSVVALSVENMKGLDVFSNTDKMPLLNETGKFVATEGYPILTVFVKGQSGDDGSETPAIQIWNGDETAPEGDGTEQSPYLITNGAELAYIIKTGGGANKYYKLTNDIYLNDVNKIDWTTGNAIGDYTPNSWYPNYKVTGFQGTIDGNGYIVYGLYLEGNPSSYVAYHEGTGLIPILAENSSTTVKNLGVDYTYLHYETTASAFVAVAPSGAYLTMDSCYAGENVTLKAATAATLRGYARNAIGANITNCYSLATLNGSRYTGLVGLTWDGANNVKLSNCYNANGIITNQEDSYYEIDSANNYESIGGSLTEGTNIVSADNMKGLDVFTNSGKMPLLNATEMFVATEGYPVLKAFAKDQIGGGDDNEEEEDIVPVQIWDGSVAEALSGNGTADSPYIVSDGAELAYVITTGGSANKFYKITSDIYLNDVNKINWTTGQAIGDYTPNSWYANHTVTAAFQGIIDGDGYMVYGLYLEGNPSSYVAYHEGAGLIPKLAENSDTAIRNLGVDYAYIHYETSASAFVAVAQVGSNLTMDGCFAGENVTLKAATAGALRAYARDVAGTTITNCYSLATTVGSSYTGLIGNIWGSNITIKNCYNANGTILSDVWQSVVDQGLENVYATDKGTYEDKVVELSAANMQGKDALINVLKMPYLNGDGKYVATDEYPILKAFAKSQVGDEEQGQERLPVEIWDGSVAETLTGNGTEDSPYLISNGAELAYVIKTGGTANTYYKLTSDIYLNNIKKIDWTTGKAIGDYAPNSWYANHTVTAAFQGIIDGDGYIVYGLYFEGNPSTYVAYHEGTALIPKLAENSSTTIKNLGVDYAYLHYETSASAFVAVALTGSYLTMDSCFAGENVTLKAATAGALRAYARDVAGTTITNCYSLATTVGSSYTGLIGNIWGSNITIKNSYNANGAILSDVWQSSVDQGLENVYATDAGAYVDKVVELSVDNMKGLDVFTSSDKMATISAEKFVPVVDAVPALKCFFKRTLVKDGVNYIGYSYDEFSDYYTTEDLSKYFWRYDHISANYDYEMDICDLVFMTIKFNAGENSADIDKDTATTVKDITILRKALIGDYDYIVRPQHYTPYTSLNGNYTYVWGDEFSGDYLDASKWGVYSKLDANPEKGYFNDKDENVIDVVDGNLKLTAYKADDGTYHSPTSVVTQNTMNFKYGYVEIRAKLPLQPGVWSSFWTKTVADKTDVASLVTSDNTTVGEVDIFEVFDTNRVCGNIVKWSENGSWYPTHKNDAQCTVPEDNGYHIYGYEWTPTEIKYYYDGVMYARFDISEPWVNKGELGKGKDGWTYKINDETGTDMSCYQDPQYIIFNNHLFYEGVSGANDYIYTQNPNFTSADYLIDYCRVYQLKGQEEIYTK